MRWYRLLLLVATLASVLGPATAVAASDHTISTVALVVNTVPPTPGIPIAVDGETTLTDAGGVARWRLATGVHDLEVPQLIEMTEGTRALFGRWSDAWQPHRSIDLTRDRVIELGLLHQHHVGFSYVDGLRQPLTEGAVQSAVFINSNGDQLTVSEEGDGSEDGNGSLDGAWLTANRLRRSGAGLRSMPAFWALREAYVGGRDVAQTGAQVLEPRPDATWELLLYVFPLEIEMRSFLYDRPVSARIDLVELGTGDDAAPVATLEVRAGRGRVEQLPRGDYQLRLEGGGFLPPTNLILTGPKTERITVVTTSLWLVAAPLLVAVAGAAYLFWRRRQARIKLLIAVAVLTGIVLNLPAIGSATGRPLSARAAPVYDAEGAFTGFEVEVRNDGPLTAEQSYCTPDFQLTVFAAGVEWAAAYESPDFHDVEMGECRIHNVSPGTSSQLFVPRPGVEWVVDDNAEIPAGTYPAYVTVFGVAAPQVMITVPAGVLPAEVLRPPSDDLFDQIPFTTPFED